MMETLNRILFTAILGGISFSSFAQQQVIIDDGNNTSKPNNLELNKIGESGNTLLYEATPNESIIRWQTSSESNTSHFEMQISFDGIKFTDVQFIAASDYTKWQTDYKVSFRRSYLSLNKIYYRLKSVFSDNSVSYTEPAAFRISAPENKIFYANLH